MNGLKLLLDFDENGGNESGALSDEDGTYNSRLCPMNRGEEESVRQSGDKDFVAAWSAAGSSMSPFICLCILAVTRSAAKNSSVLRWMFAAVDAMKELVECSFPQTLLAVLKELK